MSGHAPQMGLDTKIYFLTDHKSQRECDFNLRKKKMQTVRRLKQRAVTREDQVESWSSEVASSQKKIYQIVAL
jgi:hypothetical protein